MSIKYIVISCQRLSSEYLYSLSPKVIKCFNLNQTPNEVSLDEPHIEFLRKTENSTEKLL